MKEGLPRGGAPTRGPAHPVGSPSPANRIFGTAGVRCEDAGNLLPQNGATIPGGQPNYIPIDPKVRVDEDVPEGYDLWPRNLGVAGLHFLGDTRSRLADDGEFLNYGTAAQLRFLKCREIRSRYKLGNVVRGLKDIREI